ncbi:hypothetical protein TIFTF001_029411 [Ficus carica]|uniref:Uncharacterized protein n=1 Tax=Ficus carica TaxID=3494 RepID=A0AA88IY03_FICCA|nr:hypothetical protein TIFTF001_029411 [Ficus carica]
MYCHDLRCKGVVAIILIFLLPIDLCLNNPRAIVEEWTVSNFGLSRNQLESYGGLGGSLFLFVGCCHIVISDCNVVYIPVLKFLQTLRSCSLSSCRHRLVFTYFSYNSEAAAAFAL